MANKPGQYLPHAYKGWGDIMHVVNREFPSAMRRIEISQRRLLQTLVHKRRVRH